MLGEMKLFPKIGEVNTNFVFYSILSRVSVYNFGKLLANVWPDIFHGVP